VFFPHPVAYGRLSWLYCIFLVVFFNLAIRLYLVFLASSFCREGGVRLPGEVGVSSSYRGYTLTWAVLFSICSI